MYRLMSWTLVVAVLAAGFSSVGGAVAISGFVDVPTGHVFAADVAWMADLGITKGCNPPVNDRFCPNAVVTRGQMAAFLARALNLTDDGGGNGFVDDDDSIFESDIAKLAAAGITKGCNPPVNDRYCPNDPVTRGQMAAFLGRALSLGEGAGSDAFVDDDASIFEADIERLAEAGITRGCNPPGNDRFCPDDRVTRGQMAAFLHRISTGGIRCLATECDQISPRVAPAESWEVVGDGTYRLKDELVVVLDSVGSSAVNRAYDLAAQFDAEIVGGSPDLGAFQLYFESVTVSALLAHRDTLRLQAGVKAADFHNVVSAGDIFPSEWSYLTSSETWHLAQVGAPAAWDIASDASSVAVLISDSGIFDDHEDLAFAEPPIRRQEPAGSALRDSIHGTHVAGIAVRPATTLTSESRSAAGMAWGCELYGVDWNRSFLSDFDPEGLIDPLWAAHWTAQSVSDHNIRVVNMSWSVGPHTSRGCERDALDTDDPSDAWEAILLNLFA